MADRRRISASRRFALAAAGLAVVCASLLGASARLGHAAGPTISHEGSVSFATYGTSDSQSVTVPAVANAVLLFEFAGKNGSDALSSVTYGGQALTMLSARSQGSVRLELWYLKNPPAGTRALAWQKTGAAQNIVWGASVYSGVDQTTPFGSVGQAGATQDAGGSKSVTVSSATGELVVDAAVFNGGSGSGGPAAGPNQDVRWVKQVSTTQGGSSSTDGAPSVTTSWTPTVAPQIDWALLAVPLKPAAGSPPSPQAPIAVDKPVVTGNATEGETLQTSNGTWSNNPTSFTYSWRRCDATNTTSCSTISGAAGSSYVLTHDDVGFKIRSRVVASNAAGNSDPSDSDPTATVAAAPSAPSIVHQGSVSFGTYGASDSRPVTVGAGSNRILVVQFAGKSGSVQLTGVTYGGAPLTRLASRSQGSVRLELWYLVAPPVGTAALAWTKSGAAQNVTWGASVYTGVDQTTPFDPAAQSGASGDVTSGAKSLDVPAVAGEVVVDGVVFNGGATPGGPTAGAGQTQQWSTSMSTTQGGSSSKSAASPVTMRWTPNGVGPYDWALVGAPLRPASGAPPTVNPPTNNGAPVVTGNAYVGQTLTTSNGSWTNSPTSFTYAWKQCDAAGANCTTIGGEATSQYTIRPGDQGFRIRSEVTASNTAGPSQPASSEPTATVTLAPPPSPIAHVATTSFGAYGASDSQAVTVPTVTDGILVFTFAGKLGADQLTAVTYGGAPLTRLLSRSQGSVRLELWYLVAPPAGTRQLAWTKSGAAQNVAWAASIYSGVDQTTPWDTPAQSGASGDPAGAKSLLVPAAPNELVVDAVVFNGGPATAGPLPGAGQTARFSSHMSTTQGGASTKPSSSPVTMTWTPNGSGTFDWAIGGAALRTSQPNRAPTDISLSSTSVPEHQPVGTTVGTFSTTDPDTGQSFTYTLQSAGCGGGSFPDNASFQIAGSQLQTAAVFDQPTKSSYTICVRSTDNGAPPLSTDKQFTITVTHVNSAPTNIALSTSSFPENQPSATTIGTLSTTDPDATDTHTYTLLASNANCPGTNDSTDFQIGSGANADKLQTARSFDFETDPGSYLVCVKTTDNAGASFVKQFTLTLTNVNEAPTNITLTPSSIDENQPSGTTIGTLAATDPDVPAQTISFSFATTCAGGGADNSSFSISGTSLKSAAVFDYETKSSYAVCIRATDNGSPAASFDKQLTVTINNLNDPPVATSDSYSHAIGNTRAVVGTTTTGPSVTLTGNKLIANDTDPEGDTLTAVAETNATTLGGSVTISTDGSFVYTPPVGTKNTTDHFTYHVTDGTSTVAGTAAIGIDDALVWYADAKLSTDGDGSSHAPFNVLSSLASASGAGDTLFLYGQTHYDGGLTLKASQTLLGERNGLVVNGNTLVAAASGAVVTVEGGVVLSTNNTIQGIDFGTTGSSSVFALSGSSVGTATVNTSTSGGIDNPAGGAVSIGGSSNTLAMSFSAISSNNSSTNAVTIANASGTFAGGCTLPCSPGTLQGAGGTDVVLSGGTLGFTLNADVSDSGGQLVDVSGQTGGTKDFNGALNGGSVSLTTNTGATIRFDGKVTLSSGTATAFNATGGGTVVATDAGNTLASTTGKALNIANTTIGDDDLTFLSISSNGAVNGITVSSTSNANGALKVTGNGGTCADAATCTGGAIQNSTGNGITLSSVPGGVSLTHMQINGSADDGISGSGVAGFHLDHSRVVSNGNSASDDGVNLSQLSGTVRFDTTTVDSSAHDNVVIANTSGTVTATFTGGSYSNTNSHTTGADAILFRNDGTGTMTASVTNATFTNNRDDQIQATAGTAATGTMNLTFSGNTMNDTVGQPGNGITVNPGGTSTATLVADNNNINGSNQAAITVDGPGSAISPQRSTIAATITNNHIGSSTTPRSGAYAGVGIAVTANGGADITTLISGNDVHRYSNPEGITLVQNDGDGSLNATVRSNTVTDQAGTSNNLYGIRAVYGSDTPDTGTGCLDLGGVHPNDLTGSSPAGSSDIRIRQAGPTTLQLPGYSGGAHDTAAVAAYLNGRNTAPNGSTVSQPDPGGTFVNATSCPQP